MNPRKKSLEKLVTALDSYFEQYQSRRHIYGEILPYPIEPTFEEWRRILQKAEQENPDDLGRFVYDNAGEARQLHKAFWDSLEKARQQIFVAEPTSRRDIDRFTDEAFSDDSLRRFFEHDIGHLLGDLDRQFWIPGGGSHDDSFIVMRDYFLSLLRISLNFFSRIFFSI